MRKDPSNVRRTVAAIICSGATPLEIGIASEVFGLDRSDLGVPWYRFFICGAEPAPIRTQTGFLVHTPYGLDDLAEADTVVVCPWERFEEFPDGLLDALRQCHANGARVMSMCGAAFALAAAGLLDGRRATTHWLHAGKLAARYPAVHVDPDVLYVDEGDVLTAAGTAAGVDLCLHVVRQDFGAEVANATARRMVVPPHRDGGQAQFINTPVAMIEGLDPFTETLEWALLHLAESLTLAALARRAAMSPSSFLRRFRSSMGTTPHRWLLSQRIFAAQRLLETTEETVDRVADLCGFGSATSLRQHFQRIVRTSPAAYRRTFHHAF